MPTWIAGVYGSTLHHTPGLDASVDLGGSEVSYGYFVVLAVMLTACGTLFRAFKHSKWL